MGISAARNSVLRPLRSICPLAYLGLESFCASSSRAVQANDAANIDIKKLRVDRKRLLKELHHTCQWGEGKRWGAEATSTGMSRLALSDTDKQARDWFVDTTKQLGCDVTIDEMGNIFAIRPGLESGAPTVAGSHLDTQPSGGRYDGILGVHAGIEMLRVLNDMGIRTAYPVGVVNWTK